MKIGRLLKRFFQISLILFLAGSIALAFMLIERGKPPFSGLAVNQQQVSSTEVNRILKRIRLLTRQEHGWLQLSEKDVRLMLGHSLLRVQQLPLPVVISGNSYMNGGSLEIAASMAIDTPPGWFTRMGISLTQSHGKPQVEYFQIGRLTVPGAFVSKVWNYLLYPLLPSEQQGVWNSLADSIRHFDINDNSMLLGMQLSGELREKLQAGSLGSLIAPGTAEDRKLYQQVLEAALSTEQGSSVSLSPILRIMAGLAYTRAQMGSSAIEENKLLIYTMAQAVAPPEVRRILGGGKVTIGASRLSLHQRHDLAQHFLISAALTMQLGEDAALQIGFNKEMEDALPGGSGFSFTDLTADVAGIAFAEIAGETDNAGQLQQFLMKHEEESDYLPIPPGLPDGLSMGHFRSTFQGPGNPAYEEKFQKIETAIEYAPLYLSLN